MDYVRYPPAEYALAAPCQCDACRNAYKTHIGFDMIGPEDVKQPGVLARLIAFRQRYIRKTGRNRLALVLSFNYCT